MASSHDADSKITTIRLTNHEYRQVLRAKHRLEDERGELVTVAKLLVHLSINYTKGG